MSSEQISLFAPGRQRHYVTELDGALYSRSEDAPDELAPFRSAKERENWREVQQETMDWAVSEESREFEYDKVHGGWDVFDRYFRRRGRLVGDVLDIGGGWGLFREWWSAADGEVFVVHDPGIERFRNGAHPAHARCYSRAFSHPMVFVEGWGEALPYPDSRFDLVMCASALDHCLEPEAVFREAHRVLAPGGTFLVIQHIRDIASVAPGYHSPGSRVRRLIEDPSRLVGFVKSKMAHNHHLSSFTSSSLAKSLRAAGFMRVSDDLIDTDRGLAATEARKPYD